MASEASVADQTINEPIQGTRETNGLKNDEVVIPETNDVNGKVDEVRVEDTPVVETASPVIELKQQDTEIHVPEDTKEVEVNDDKSAFALSVESTQKELVSESNLPISQESDAHIVKVTKEEEEGADESVKQEAENESNSPDSQQSVSDQAEEVKKEEAKDNEAAAEPVESGEKEVEDPVNLPDIEDNVSQAVDVTKEVANDSKSDLEPAVESVDRELEVETGSPPTQDADTQSVEVKEEEVDTALEPSSESAGVEVENASNLSGTQQSDTPIAKEIKEVAADKNQDMEQSVESEKEELGNETKSSGTPEPSNEAQDKPTEVVEDIAQESETELKKESVTEVASEVQSDLPEAPGELATESVAEDKVVSEVQSDLPEAPGELATESFAEDNVVSEVQSDLPEAPGELATESFAEDKVVSEVQSDLPEAPAELTLESLSLAEDKVVNEVQSDFPEAPAELASESVVEDKVVSEVQSDLPEAPAELASESVVEDKVVSEVQSDLAEAPAELASESVAEDKVVEPHTVPIPEPTDDVGTVGDTSETTDLPQVEKTVDHEVQVKLETLDEVPSNGTSELATEEKTTISQSSVVENPTEVISESKDVVEAVASDILTPKKDDSNVSSDTNGISELATEEQTAKSESLVVENPTELISEPKDVVETVVSEILTANTNGTSELTTEEETTKSESVAVENPTEVIGEPKDIVEAVIYDVLSAKKDDSNVSSDANGASDLATEEQSAKSESLVFENPTEVIGDPKDVLQAVASDILTAKKDGDPNVSSDTKDYENGTVDVISSAATTATENWAILVSVAESRKEDQENPVEVEKPHLIEKSEATVTTEVENPTVTETTDNMKENGIAEDGKEIMDSAAPEVTIEEKGEALESTSRDIDVDGMENKVSETTTETNEVGAEPKQTRGKHTLLEKFASETSEDKKGEAGDVEDRSLPETTTDGNDTKADGEPPKQEIPVKTSQRQSSNIISKVKKSIGKVKKAITGKSPSSKTSTSENKDTTKA